MSKIRKYAQKFAYNNHFCIIMKENAKAILQIRRRKGRIEMPGQSARTRRFIANYLLDSFSVDDAYLDKEQDCIIIQCWNDSIDREAVISALMECAEESGTTIEVESLT